MPTDQLKPCLHCGERISRLAEICPKCQAEKPNGVVCRICDQRVPFNEAICVKGDHGYHRRCLAPEFAYTDLSCPHCDRPITTKHVSFDTILSKAKPDCPHCGNPDVLGSIGDCDCCGLPICTALGHRNAAPIASTSRTHSFCQTDPTRETATAAALLRHPNVVLLVLGAVAFYYLFVALGI